MDTRTKYIKLKWLVMQGFIETVMQGKLDNTQEAFEWYVEQVMEWVGTAWADD